MVEDAAERWIERMLAEHAARPRIRWNDDSWLSGRLRRELVRWDAVRAANHPTVREALNAVLDSELPNLVQMGVSALSGVLAERLLAFVPHLDKVFFSNSGSEAVEAAIKFARAATRRSGIVYCSHAFHGLTYGSLSLNGDQNFRDGFGPLVPHCIEVAFNDLAALEQALASRTIAAFFVEPIQGKGVTLPSCRRNPDRTWSDGSVSCKRALGYRTRHGAARQSVVRRPRADRCSADPQMGFRQSLQLHGSGGRSRIDVFKKRSRHGGGTRNLGSDRIRTTDRKIGTIWRTAAALV